MIKILNIDRGKKNKKNTYLQKKSEMKKKIEENYRTKKTRKK